MRVLIVEDDAAIADAVGVALRRDGAAVDVASSLRQARGKLAGVDLVVLDLGLPDGSGFELLAALRGKSDAPRVIVLTSRDEEIDCVAALEAGADDFIAKPFSPRALVARARAVLRRHDRGDANEARIETGLLAIDLAARVATWRDRAIELTRLELDLLAALARAPGRVLSRAQLVETVWGAGVAMTERTVDSHLKTLRKKLDHAGAPPTLVENVRGVGFKLQQVAR